MRTTIEKTCPQCGQQLRFPGDVGGVVMACPECGKKFRTDFKLGGSGKNNSETIFELPSTLLEKLLRRIRR